MSGFGAIGGSGGSASASATVVDFTGAAVRERAGVGWKVLMFNMGVLVAIGIL